MEEDSEEITISYETLFELLVRERSRGELQKLPNDFYNKVADYLKEKENQLKQEPGKLDVVVEMPKIKKEIENIKQIAKDLYNRREKKILNLALDKSKTQSSIVDVQLLLDEEKELFDNLLDCLDGKRKLLMDKLNGGVPKEVQKEESKEAPKVEAKEESKEAGVKTSEDKTEVNQESKNDTPIEDKKEDEPNKVPKLVRFIHAVPKFLGLEGEEYGPFEEEDVASLPASIVDLLLKKGRVEEIRES